MTGTRLLQLERHRIVLERQRVAALASKRVLTSPMHYIEDRALALEYATRRFEDAIQREMTSRRGTFGAYGRCFGRAESHEGAGAWICDGSERRGYDY